MSSLTKFDGLTKTIIGERVVYDTYLSLYSKLEKDELKGIRMVYCGWVLNKPSDRSAEKNPLFYAHMKKQRLSFGWNAFLNWTGIKEKLLDLDDKEIVIVCDERERSNCIRVEYISLLQRYWNGGIKDISDVGKLSEALVSMKAKPTGRKFEPSSYQMSYETDVIDGNGFKTKAKVVLRVEYGRFDGDGFYVSYDHPYERGVSGTLIKKQDGAWVCQPDVGVSTEDLLGAISEMLILGGKRSR